MNTILIEELIKELENRLNDIKEKRNEIYQKICDMYMSKYTLERRQNLIKDSLLSHLMSGNNWHYIITRKNGRSYYYDNELDKYKHMIDRIGIEYIIGNDAPMKGQEGNYLQFKFTQDGFNRQLVLKDTEFKPLLIIYYNILEEYNFINEKLKQTIDIKDKMK